MIYPRPSTLVLKLFYTCYKTRMDTPLHDHTESHIPQHHNQGIPFVVVMLWSECMSCDRDRAHGVLPRVTKTSPNSLSV